MSFDDQARPNNQPPPNSMTQNGEKEAPIGKRPTEMDVSGDSDDVSADIAAEAPYPVRPYKKIVDLEDWSLKVANLSNGRNTLTLLGRRRNDNGALVSWNSSSILEALEPHMVLTNGGSAYRVKNFAPELWPSCPVPDEIALALRLDGFPPDWSRFSTRAIFLHKQASATHSVLSPHSPVYHPPTVLPPPAIRPIPGFTLGSPSTHMNRPPIQPATVQQTLPPRPYPLLALAPQFTPPAVVETTKKRPRPWNSSILSDGEPSDGENPIKASSSAAPPPPPRPAPRLVADVIVIDDDSDDDMDVSARPTPQPPKTPERKKEPSQARQAEAPSSNHSPNRNKWHAIQQPRVPLEPATPSRRVAVGNPNYSPYSPRERAIDITSIPTSRYGRALVKPSVIPGLSHKRCDMRGNFLGLANVPVDEFPVFPSRPTKKKKDDDSEWEPSVADRREQHEDEDEEGRPGEGPPPFLGAVFQHTPPRKTKPKKTTAARGGTRRARNRPTEPNPLEESSEDEIDPNLSLQSANGDAPPPPQAQPESPQAMDVDEVPPPKPAKKTAPKAAKKTKAKAPARAAPKRGGTAKKSTSSRNAIIEIPDSPRPEPEPQPEGVAEKNTDSDDEIERLLQSANEDYIPNTTSELDPSSRDRKPSRAEPTGGRPRRAAAKRAASTMRATGADVDDGTIPVARPQDDDDDDLYIAPVENKRTHTQQDDDEEDEWTEEQSARLETALVTADPTSTFYLRDLGRAVPDKTIAQIKARLEHKKERTAAANAQSKEESAAKRSAAAPEKTLDMDAKMKTKKNRKILEEALARDEEGHEDDIFEDERFRPALVPASQLSMDDSSINDSLDLPPIPAIVPATQPEPIHAPATQPDPEEEEEDEFMQDLRSTNRVNVVSRYRSLHSSNAANSKPMWLTLRNKSSSQPTITATNRKKTVADTAKAARLLQTSEATIQRTKDIINDNDEFDVEGGIVAADDFDDF